MKMEKETNEPLKPTETIKQSAFEEFLEEWGSWRGKKKAAKNERDSHIVQPRGKARKKPQRLEDSVWFMLLKICASLVMYIAELLMTLFSFFFSFKTILIIAAIIYFFDFDFKAKIVSDLKTESGIEQTEDVQRIIQEKLEAAKDKLGEFEIKIKKTDGTVHTFDNGDVDDWFTSESGEPEKEPFTQTPLIPKE